MLLGLPSTDEFRILLRFVIRNLRGPGGCSVQAWPGKGRRIMAVKIRLRRTGSTKQPSFRIVATDERFATDGRFLENLGWYDPKRTGSNYEIKLDRVQYWQDCGAICSGTVRSIVKKAQAAKA